jgi:hypothetical protein
MMPQLAALLHAAYQDRADLRLAEFAEAELRWILETGLAPLLLRAVKSDPEVPRSSSLWQQLKSAELAARVLTGDRMEAMVKIIDRCHRKAVNLTLLKGISICQQYYPEPHLRSMGDIDFLVDEADLTTVHSVLLRLGYNQRTTFREFYRAHHHGMPWFHPQKGIWIEVHRALFRADSQLGKLTAFSSGNIKAESTPSLFEGRHVSRLSPEFQLIYTASHWARTLDANRGVFGLLDAIYLLRNARQFQWEKVFRWVGHSVASTHLYTVLSYLCDGHIVDLPKGVLDEAFKKQRSFGTLNLKMIHFLITRNMLEGRVPQGRLTIRNFDILWRTLLLNHNPLYNLILLLRNLLLPFRIREAIFS